MNEKIEKRAKLYGAVFDYIGMGRHDGVLFTKYELELFAKDIINECLEIVSHEILMDEINGAEAGMRRVREEFEVE